MLFIYKLWDCFSVCFSSGIKKKIVAASNRRGQKELLGWFRAITNHFYWSCDTSKGDQEVSMESGGCECQWVWSWGAGVEVRQASLSQLEWDGPLVCWYSKSCKLTRSRVSLILADRPCGSLNMDTRFYGCALQNASGLVCGMKHRTCIC